MVDLASEYAAHRAEIDAAIADVLQGGAFILGPRVESFEKAFAQFTGANHCIGVGSGTDALILSLEAMGVGPGDEVIMPANTFAATAMAVTTLGAVPRFVDCEPSRLLIDLSQVASAITPRTRALVAVHLYGQMVDVAAMRAHGLPILEDAAQGHGAMLGDQRVGTAGDIAAFSFYPTKNLGGVGDGGAVTTNNADMAQRIQRVRTYGQDRKNHHVVIGRNSRLDELQAAVLNIKLPHLAKCNERRREIARYYDAHLKVDRLPIAAGDVHHLYVIRHPRRDWLAQQLEQAGIQSAVYYPVPLHLQPCFAHLGYRKGSFPVAESTAEQILSLPVNPYLTQAQIDHVVHTVNALTRQ